MRYLDRANEPDFWATFKKHNPRVNYDRLTDSAEGKEMKKRLLDFLVEEQSGLCAYCCKSIRDKSGKPCKAESMIEHIKPRHGQGDRYSQYSMDYDNMVASCTSKGHCDDAKGGVYDEALFVSPLDCDCGNHFAYEPNGKIVGKTEKGCYTIDLLKLNSKDLRDGRRATWQACEGMLVDMDVNEVLGVYLGKDGGESLSFPDAAEAYCKLYGQLKASDRSELSVL